MYRNMNKILLIFTIVASLSGCGKSGALYLPDNNSLVQNSWV